ncbi:uncharacterized protein LOC122319674 [Drosophila yakuba]|uniref:uncharacterized protein LOC122319674 n=1 Tax=Drosophila yakuba TaxID=7245 RepID=UPI001C89D2F5|nr:uncharacterized protein LOC122319674 [Drosophila yakuba]
MRPPPDIWKEKPSPTSKFLIITRTDETTFAGVSPFTIKNVIDLTAEGAVVSCKRLRDGNLLLQTKTTILHIPVAVSEHRTLNYSKGVIYFNDLRGIEEEEILHHLKSQKVSAVRKIMKTLTVEPTETGLITLTFEKLDLPEYVYIGYERVQVRPDIPAPMRCNNCLRLGHLQKFCKNTETCFMCSQPAHIDFTSGEKCERGVCCINCTGKRMPDNKHHPRDRNCPVFFSNKEIQAIKTLQKVDNRTAWSLYRKRHHHDGSLYASVAIHND